MQTQNTMRLSETAVAGNASKRTQVPASTSDMLAELQRLREENAHLRRDAGSATLEDEGRTVVVRIPLGEPKISSTHKSWNYGFASGRVMLADGKELRVTATAYVPIPKDDRASEGTGE